MVMKYRRSLVVSIIMIVCGVMLLVIVPIMMGVAASYVTSESFGWWRTVWYIGLALGYTAYILMIVGVLLLVITVLRELHARKKNKQIED